MGRKVELIPKSIRQQATACYAETHRAADLISRVDVELSHGTDIKELEPVVRELANCLREAGALALTLQRRAVGVEMPKEG